jgi:hypothetical protein
MENLSNGFKLGLVVFLVVIIALAVVLTWFIVKRTTSGCSSGSSAGCDAGKSCLAPCNPSKGCDAGKSCLPPCNPSPPCSPGQSCQKNITPPRDPDFPALKGYNITLSSTTPGAGGFLFANMTNYNTNMLTLAFSNKAQNQQWVIKNTDNPGSYSIECVGTAGKCSIAEAPDVNDPVKAATTTLSDPSGIVTGIFTIKKSSGGMWTIQSNSRGSYLTTTNLQAGQPQPAVGDKLLWDTTYPTPRTLWNITPVV